MNEIAGVISAQGRAALSLRDLFYRAAPARAQIFTRSSRLVWRTSEGPFEAALPTLSESTRTALGAITYHADTRPLTTHESPALPVVLKGRIANFRSLRKHLVAAGFASACDDEPTLIARLIHMHMINGASPIEAARVALSKLQGFIAFIAAPDGDGSELIAASNGCELFLGFDRDEALAFTDQRAIRSRDAMMALRAGDVATLNTDRIAIIDADGMHIEKHSRPLGVRAPAVGGG